MMKPLIEKQRIATSFGEIAYLEAGPPEAPPVLLIHGIPTSGYLWRQVMRFLCGELHCIAPDLMGLGDTSVPVGGGVFHMEAQAEMLEELMDNLGYRTFAVVAHDQGGAAAQLLAAQRSERLTALVLTDCVCYDNWPVPAVARLQALARVPLLSDLAFRSGLFQLRETATPLSAFRRGLYDPRKISDEAITEYLRPLHSSAEERRRFVRFLLAGSPSFTLRAVDGLRRFTKPTMILWAGDDRYISPSWGRKLFEEIPGAERFELIPLGGHFWRWVGPTRFWPRASN
jgi:pimeloyl-ACP methyl ester carboxylesterase